MCQCQSQAADIKGKQEPSNEDEKNDFDSTSDWNAIQSDVPSGNRSSVVLKLPPDAWRVVSAFLSSVVLMQVCTSIRKAVRSEYLHLFKAPQLLQLRGDKARLDLVRRLVLELPHGRLRPHRASLLEALAALKEAPSLVALHLDLRSNGLCNGNAWQLLTAINAPMLQSFSADLSNNQVWVSSSGTPRHGATLFALESLQKAHSLTTLHLDLSNNRMRRGRHGLEQLRHAPALRTLHLNLSHNEVVDTCAEELSELRHSSSLRTLHLDVSNNWIGDIGAQRLARLGENPRLRNLHLNLHMNRFSAQQAYHLHAMLRRDDGWDQLYVVAGGMTSRKAPGKLDYCITCPPDSTLESSNSATSCTTTCPTTAIELFCHKILRHQRLFHHHPGMHIRTVYSVGLWIALLVTISSLGHIGQVSVGGMRLHGGKEIGAGNGGGMAFVGGMGTDWGKRDGEGGCGYGRCMGQGQRYGRGWSVALFTLS